MADPAEDKRVLEEMEAVIQRVYGKTAQALRIWATVFLRRIQLINGIPKMDLEGNFDPNYLISDVFVVQMRSYYDKECKLILIAENGIVQAKQILGEAEKIINKYKPGKQLRENLAFLNTVLESVDAHFLAIKERLEKENAYLDLRLQGHERITSFKQSAGLLWKEILLHKQLYKTVHQKATERCLGFIRKFIKGTAAFAYYASSRGAAGTFGGLALSIPAGIYGFAAGGSPKLVGVVAGILVAFGGIVGTISGIVQAVEYNGMIMAEIDLKQTVRALSRINTAPS